MRSLGAVLMVAGLVLGYWTLKTHISGSSPGNPAQRSSSAQQGPAVLQA